MEYRIKHVAMLGYFAQVKKGLFRGWLTIGKHPSGYGEYDEDHLEYPLSSRGEAILRAHAHADHNKAKRGFTSYRSMP